MRRIVSATIALALAMSGCSATPEVSLPRLASPEIAAATEWTESNVFLDLVDPAEIKRVSPDGSWLATASYGRLCLYSLDEAKPALCVAEETLGADTLSWSPDSTGVLSGGSTSGRWNTTAVWRVATDGSSMVVSPVEAGSVLSEDSPSVFDVGMAFRPDGRSIVFVQADLTNDRFELVEIDAGGGEATAIAVLDGFAWPGLLPVVPLDDQRVLINAGDFTEQTVELVDGIQSTQIATGETRVPGLLSPQVATEVTHVAGGMALVALPGFSDARSWEVDPSSWSLFDFEGREFPFATTSDRHVVSATFSPDGTHVAYLTIELPGPDTWPQGLALEAELHITPVEAVVAGEPPLASRLLDIDGDTVGYAGIEDLDALRWTTDDRIFINTKTFAESVLVEVKVSAGS